MTGSSTVAIIQARLGSQRFPQKVLRPVLGRPALQLLIDRLRRARTIDDIVLVIPDTPDNDDLVEFAQTAGVRCIRGSEQDVLARFAAGAREVDATAYVRITGDCPFIDPEVVDRVVEARRATDAPDAFTDESFPDGFDVEVVTAEMIHRAEAEATDPYDREHVTPWIRRMAGARSVVVTRGEPTDLRVTLDEPADLEVITAVAGYFRNDEFSVDDVIGLSRTYPELFRANAHLRRNEGATMTNGEKLWRRAKSVIPGGNMLLSKRSEMFLPEGWPAYFSRAKGCRVWDLDDRELIDVGLMGVGTNILGYGFPDVDDAVRRTIDLGTMSTLNCPEEVELAERLVELHPWSDMVRFARSGGEACSIAVRIARAYSHKPVVAFCGYHGWHDWYLAANLAEDSALDGHLLSGLEPNGVPRTLTGSARPFEYNDLAGLEALLSNGDVGVIFMEVRRSSEPEPGFLQNVRDLATAHGAVLVFDECTSGFRRNLGGIHLTYGVDPDLATFGKTLGNGYAITAVVGREDVMQAAQSTFISSTFWTERIGPTAGVATLVAMAAEDAPRRIDLIGTRVQSTWSDLGQRVGLEIVPAGVPSLATFSITGFDATVVKTWITQEMLKRGFIAGTALYASIAHTDDVLDLYFENLELVLGGISDAGSDDALLARLDAGPAQSGFRRLA